MKTSHIIIGAAAAAVIGYLVYTRLRAPAKPTTSTPTTASTIVNNAANAVNEVLAKLGAKPTSSPSSGGDVATARANESGLDITSEPEAA